MTNLQRYTYPTFDNAMTGSFLTPPLPKGSKKKLYLDRQGCQILIEQGKIFRERGWWLSGQDKLASDSTNLKAGWQQGRLWMRNSSLCSREHCNALLQTIHLFLRTQYRLDFTGTARKWD